MFQLFGFARFLPIFALWRFALRAPSSSDSPRSAVSGERRKLPDNLPVQRTCSRFRAIGIFCNIFLFLRFNPAGKIRRIKNIPQ
jgi:hypothetical protein